MKQIRSYFILLGAIFFAVFFASSCSNNDDSEYSVEKQSEGGSDHLSVDSLSHGYWFANSFIELNTIDSSLYYVQARVLDNQLSEEQLMKHFPYHVIESIEKWHGGYKIRAFGKLSDDNLYLSKWYGNSQIDGVVVLPIIRILFKLGTNLSNFIGRYSGLITQIGSEPGNYTFACDLSASDQVLTLLARLNKEPDVVWCEPVMLTDIESIESDGIVGKWCLNKVVGMLSTMTFYAGEVLCSIDRDGRISVKNVYSTTHPFFKETGTYSYSIKSEGRQIEIDGREYLFEIKDGNLVLDAGAAWDADCYYFSRIQ